MSTSVRDQHLQRRIQACTPLSRSGRKQSDRKTAHPAGFRRLGCRRFIARIFGVETSRRLLCSSAQWHATTDAGVCSAADK